VKLNLTIEEAKAYISKLTHIEAEDIQIGDEGAGQAGDAKKAADNLGKSYTSFGETVKNDIIRKEAEKTFPVGSMWLCLANGLVNMSQKFRIKDVDSSGILVVYEVNSKKELTYFDHYGKNEEFGLLSRRIDVESK
jgi:hypothetical protein